MGGRAQGAAPTCDVLCAAPTCDVLGAALTCDVLCATPTCTRSKDPPPPLYSGNLPVPKTLDFDEPGHTPTLYFQSDPPPIIIQFHNTMWGGGVRPQHVTF